MSRSHLSDLVQFGWEEMLDAAGLAALRTASPTFSKSLDRHLDMAGVLAANVRSSGSGALWRLLTGLRKLRVAGGSVVISALCGRLTDEDWRIRQAIIGVLTELAGKGNTVVANAVSDLLRDPTPDVRETAARSLADLCIRGDAAAVSALTERLWAEVPVVRQVVLVALGEIANIGDPAVINGVLACLAGCTDVETQLVALATTPKVCRSGDARAIIAIMKSLDHPSLDVRRTALSVLSGLELKEWYDECSRVDDENDAGGRDAIAMGCDAKCLSRIRHCCGSTEDVEVREVALAALGRLSPPGDTAALETLRQALADRNACIRGRALLGLINLAAPSHRDLLIPSIATCLAEVSPEASCRRLSAAKQGIQSGRLAGKCTFNDMDREILTSCALRLLGKITSRGDKSIYSLVLVHLQPGASRGHSWRITAAALQALAAVATAWQPEAVACAALFLEDASLCSAAAMALGMLCKRGDPAIIPRMAACLPLAEPKACVAFVKALGRKSGRGDDAVLGRLYLCLDHQAEEVRIETVLAIRGVARHADNIAVSALAALVGDNELHSVRKVALRVLPEICQKGDAMVVCAVAKAVKSEDVDARVEAVTALGAVAEAGDSVAIHALTGCLRDQTVLEARLKALEILPRLAARGDPRCASDILSALRGPCPRLRQASATALAAVAKKGDALTESTLLARLGEEDETSVKIAVIQALADIAEFGNERVLAALASLPERDGCSLEMLKATLLGMQKLARLGEPILVSAVGTVVARRNSDSWPTAIAVLARVAGRGNPAAVAAVLSCLRDASPLIRRDAAISLGLLAEHGAATAELRNVCLQDYDEGVRQGAAIALRALGSSPTGATSDARCCRQTALRPGGLLRSRPSLAGTGRPGGARTQVHDVATPLSSRGLSSRKTPQTSLQYQSSRSRSPRRLLS